MHEIEQMAYVGQTPWHGLGNVLEAGADLETWRVQAGLNWEMRESPVFFYAEPTALREAPNKKVLYRSDSLEPMSVVGKDYNVFQPGQVLEFYRDLIADFGFVLETAGSLKGGLKVWALARTGDSAFLKAQDELKGYLLLATSYDTSFATTAQFTSVRVVCNNTLQMSLNRESGAIKVRHNQQFNEVEVKAQLGLSRERFDEFMAAAGRLQQIQITAAAAREFYRNLMQVPVEDDKVKPRELGDKNLADRLTETFVGQHYIAPEDTAWGAVNVVTEYLDHVRRESTPGNRLDSAWFGRGATIKGRALNLALELA